MILIDYRQLANITFHSGFKYNGYDMDKFKQQFLNYILHFKTRFANYGELVICLDGRNYWRKDVFKYYKASRKTARDSSDLDYTQIYKIFDSMTEDLINKMPWKVVGAERAEADDIIGVLAAKFHKTEKIMIISADRDFLQLQQYPGVSQYSPLQKKMLVEKNPQVALREKIIRGDGGDGVPNCRTRDDIFVSEGKSEQISKKWLEPRLKAPSIESLLTEQENVRYARNKLLIDLSNVPRDIAANIIKAYQDYVPAKKSGVYGYLNENNYINLMDQLSSF